MDGVRNCVDESNQKGLFLLTGSTAVDETEITHTGTGRIHRLLMYPMSLWESGDSNGKISIMDLFDNPNMDITGIKSDLSIDDLIFVMCRGGWPETLKIDGRKNQLEIAKIYLDSICERDVSTVDGVKRNSERVKHLLKSYARNISTIAKDTKIMADMAEQFGNISKGTFYSYVGALKKLYIIKNIHGWSPNISSASSDRATTKKEFIDPSIAVAALNLTPEKLLFDLKTAGFIFETLCIRDLSVYTSEFGGTVHYFHKSDVLDVDCVLLLDDGRYALIEFELGSFEIEKGASHLLGVNSLIKENIDLGNTKIPEPAFLAIIYGGEYAYSREDGVKVIPIGCLR